VNEAYLYALKLLEKRDYTVSDLRRKLNAKFQELSDDIISELVRKNFLNDRRFAENYVAKRKDRERETVRAELIAHGVPAEVIAEILAQTDWPSLREAVAAKMKRLKLRAPLQSRDAARLFRALLRLGYDEDAIREEIEQLHEK
jgi:SOS response regulatory protein OraA/RecX